MTKAAAPALCILAMCVLETPALAMIFYFQRVSNTRIAVSCDWQFIDAEGDKDVCSKAWRVICSGTTKVLLAMSECILGKSFQKERYLN